MERGGGGGVAYISSPEIYASDRETQKGRSSLRLRKGGQMTAEIWKFYRINTKNSKLIFRANAF